jgi:glycosyltransferase involved in cell wall biosynthesis
MALVLKWLLRTRFVFDVRGLMADEYVEAGLWKANGVLYRLTKRMEAVFLANADAVVVLTRRARAWLIESGRFRDHVPPIETIPCCVDLERFRVDPEKVEQLRREIGIDGHIVMVYAGKLGGWYMTREMVDFFTAARRHLPHLQFLVLTQSDCSLIEEEFANRSVDRSSYHCSRVLPEHLPAFLAVADFAISFRTPRFAQMAASPTKMGEYFAAGLPVVYNAGIGDLDELESERVGVLVKTFAEGDYERAARQMGALLEDRQSAASRCRAVAQKQFSLSTVGVPRYLRLYAALMGLSTLGTKPGHTSLVTHVGSTSTGKPVLRVRDKI